MNSSPQRDTFYPNVFVVAKNRATTRALNVIMYKFTAACAVLANGRQSVRVNGDKHDPERGASSVQKRSLGSFLPSRVRLL